MSIFSLSICLGHYIVPLYGRHLGKEYGCRCNFWILFSGGFRMWSMGGRFESVGWWLGHLGLGSDGWLGSLGLGDDRCG